MDNGIILSRVKFLFSLGICKLKPFATVSYVYRKKGFIGTTRRSMGRLHRSNSRTNNTQLAMVDK